MSMHVCKCARDGKVEYHLRYPGLTEAQAQEIANKINAGCLNWPPPPPTNLLRQGIDILPKEGA